MWPNPMALRPRRSNTVPKVSKPDLAASPVDSGYASSCASSERENTKPGSPPSPRSLRSPRSPRYLDGPGSFDDPFSDSDDNTLIHVDPPSTPTPFKTPSPRVHRPVCLSVKSDLSIPSTFHSGEQSSLTKRPARSQSTPQRTSPAKFPDRFVAQRDQSTPLSERFQTTKPTAHLTPEEKVIRRDHVTPDPFCYRKRAVAPMASDYRTVSSETSHRSSSEQMSPLVMACPNRAKLVLFLVYTRASGRRPKDRSVTDPSGPWAASLPAAQRWKTVMAG